MFTYNNSSQAWVTVPNTNGTLVAGYPYRLFVRGDRGIDLGNNNATATNTILRSSGSLVTGDVVYNTGSTTTYQANSQCI